MPYLSDAELFEKSLQSPALKEQHKSDDRSAYPANYRGRVPLKVKMAKDVRPDTPVFLTSGRNIIAKMDCEYFVWVNKHGAVAAILEDGEKLGLLPQEFDVVAWHEETEKNIVEKSALFQE